MKGATAKILPYIRRYGKYLIPSVAYSALSSDARARYLTASWSLGIIAAGFLILSNQGLFTVLMPGAYFPWPVSDKRTPVILTGYDRVTGKPVSTKKLMLPSDDSAVLARRIAFLINEPSLIQDKSLDSEFHDIDNLPELAYAIKKIWAVPSQSEISLYIDLREETITEEARSFTESRAEDPARMTEYMDRYFEALTRSVFANDPKVRSVRFFIDGNSRDIEGMNFRLSREYTRGMTELK